VDCFGRPKTLKVRRQDRLRLGLDALAHPLGHRRRAAIDTGGGPGGLLGAAEADGCGQDGRG